MYMYSLFICRLKNTYGHESTKFLLSVWSPFYKVSINFQSYYFLFVHGHVTVSNSIKT